MLGLGMTAGVIGVTAGVAGATAPTAVLTASNATHVNSTGTNQAAGTLTDALTLATAAPTAATETFPFEITAPASGATWGTLPTVACYHTVNSTSSDKVTGCTVAATSGTAKILNVSFPATATSATARFIDLTSDKVTTSSVAASTAIAVTAEAANGYAASSPATIATVKAAATTSSTATTVVPPSVPSITAGGTTTVNMKSTWAVPNTAVLHLRVTAPSGTVDWVSATHAATTATVSGVTGYGTATLRVTVTGVSASATSHVTLTSVSLKTTGAGAGSVTVTPSLYNKTGVKITGDTWSNTAHPAQVLVASTKTATLAATGTAPSIGPTATNTGSAGLKVTLNTALTGTTAGTSYYLILHVATVSGTKVDFNGSTPTASTTGFGSWTVTPSSSTTSTLNVTLAAGAHTPAYTTSKGATITLSGLGYDTHGAHGTVTVTAQLLNQSTRAYVVTSATESAFKPATAVTAVAPAAPATQPSTITLSSPTGSNVPVGVKMTDQPANTLSLALTGTKSKTELIAKGSVLEFNLLQHGAAAACVSSTDYTEFDGAPTVSFTGTTSKHVSGTPKVTATVSHSSTVTATCNSTARTDVLKLKFTTAITLPKNSTSNAVAQFMVTGIHYSTGSAATLGSVEFANVSQTTLPAPSITSNAANASVADAWLTTTKASVKQGAFDASITPVSVVEATGAPGHVTKGWVCITITGSHKYFNTSATASVKVAKGNAKVGSTVKYLPATSATATTVAFDVTTASTTTASTFTVSGLAVNAPTGVTTATVTAKYGATTTCGFNAKTLTTTTPALGTGPIFMTETSSTQIYGSTADATAAKLLENRFTTATGLAAHCINTTNLTTSAANRPVVLATTEHFQDALSSQYLASYLKTGTLLTPTAKLSTVTLDALKNEGVTQVDVVGGPLVVSTTVIAQLETTPAYSCGGGQKLLITGKPRYITVTRIYGQTATDTAAAIADFAPSTHVESKAFTAAYAGINTTKGNGAFNDTSGSASLVPLTGKAVPTAILASTTEFQDAMAASAASYAQTTGKSFPILLTNPMSLSAAAQGAIATLGIKQVILMGGPLAVTNSVVTSLESLGVQVLRVAGHTYTDTATQLAKFEESTTGLDWDTGATVAVARGNGFTDGLVGADNAGNLHEPLLLTDSPVSVGQYLTAFLKAAGTKGTAIDSTDGNKISALTIYGGPLAVSPTVVSKMETDIG